MIEFGILLAFVGVVCGQGECNTNGTTTACCVDVLGTGLCANITWIPAQQAVKVASSFGPVQLLSFTFTENDTSTCTSGGGFKFCFEVANFTVDASGTCGCLEVDVSVGPLQINEQIGCFAFGSISSCPNTNCGLYTSCSTCNLFPWCGFCYDKKSTGQCEQGDQSGPTMGSCNPPLVWIDHVAQCPN